MSGGTFEYKQYELIRIADIIQEFIDSNDDESLNEWGNPRGRKYSHDTLFRFREAVELLRRAEIYAHRIDWLLADDDGEEGFHRRLDESLIQFTNG